MLVWSATSVTAVMMSPIAWAWSARLRIVFAVASIRSRSRSITAAIDSSIANRPAWPVATVRSATSPTVLRRRAAWLAVLRDLIDGGDGLGHGGGLFLGAAGLLGGAGEDLDGGRGELAHRRADRLQKPLDPGPALLLRVQERLDPAPGFLFRVQERPRSGPAFLFRVQERLDPGPVFLFRVQERLDPAPALPSRSRWSAAGWRSWR